MHRLVSEFGQKIAKVQQVAVPQHFMRFWNFFAATLIVMDEFVHRPTCSESAVKISTTDQRDVGKHNRTALLFFKRIKHSVCTHTHTYRGVIGASIKVLAPPRGSVGTLAGALGSVAA